MNAGFDKMNRGFEKMNAGFEKMDKGFEDINNKLDILKNSNMAQILNAQTQNTKEITEKLDKYIEKNEVEHKKFEYDIADIKMKLRFAR